MKTMAERKFFSLELSADDLLRLVLCHCDVETFDSTAGESFELPGDLRVVKLKASVDGDILHLVLESDSLPESCKFKGYYRFVRPHLKPAMREVRAWVEP